MARSYTVAGQTFSTQKSLREYIQNLVDRYDDSAPLSAEDRAFVLDLLRLHPDDKSKGGIDSIWVAHHPEHGNTRCFWLRYLDGTVDDFSWVKCLSNKTKVCA